MAQFRADREEWQLELIACYAEHGVKATPLASGGVLPPLVNLERDPPGMAEFIYSVTMECFRQVETLHWWQGPIGRDAYERMLDSRRCLIAQGYEIPEPPSFEVWLEGNAMWFPHEYVWNAVHRYGGGWTAQAWTHINTVCPQPGPHGFHIGDDLPDRLPYRASGQSAQGPASEFDFDSDPWVEPEWMAQYRRDIWEWQRELRVCYAEHGITFEPRRDGQGEIVDSVHRNTPPADDPLDDPDFQAYLDCSQRHPWPNWWDHWTHWELWNQGESADPSAYDRIADARRCLAAHGFTVPAQPSFDEWLEDPWWDIHRQVVNAPHPEGIDWTLDMWFDLWETCPSPIPATARSDIKSSQ